MLVTTIAAAVRLTRLVVTADRLPMVCFALDRPLRVLLEYRLDFFKISLAMNIVSLTATASSTKCTKCSALTVLGAPSNFYR